MKNIIRWVPFCTMLMTTSWGCGLFSTDPLAPAALGAPYTFRFRNITNTDVNDVYMFIMYRGEPVTIGIAGVLPPSPGEWTIGAGGRTNAAPQRIPDTVILKWITLDNEKHSQEISLKGIVRNMDNFDGTIWFSYADNGWHTTAFSKDQTLWRVSHHINPAPDN